MPKIVGANIFVWSQQQIVWRQKIVSRQTISFGRQKKLFPGARKKNASKIFDLLTVQTPHDVIQDLKGNVDNFHIYAFGGIKKTSEWLQKENYYV